MGNAHAPLLPPNATALERLHDEAADLILSFGEALDGLTGARENPPPQMLPFLVWQLGLGELTPYLPSLFALIDEGIDWQRIRGTPAAIRKGLGWIGYGFDFLDEETDRLCGCLAISSRRLRWNRFQLRLDRVRDRDLPDLEQISGIVQLSVPERSKFARGFRGYDVRACEAGYQRTGGSLAGTHSGVYLPAIADRWRPEAITVDATSPTTDHVWTLPAEAPPIAERGPLWSFGRRHEGTSVLGEEDLTALGVWIAPVTGDFSGLWAAMDTPWDDADARWSIADNAERAVAISTGLVEKAAWLRFREAGGALIGHARASVRLVRAAAGGEYRIGAQSFRVVDADEEPEAIVVRAHTRFADMNGRRAGSMSVVFDGEVSAFYPPGALWLAEDGLTDGVEVASTPVDFAFGITVREHALILLRF